MCVCVCVCVGGGGGGGEVLCLFANLAKEVQGAHSREGTLCCGFNLTLVQKNLIFIFPFVSA